MNQTQTTAVSTPERESAPPVVIDIRDSAVRCNCGAMVSIPFSGSGMLAQCPRCLRSVFG